MKKYRLTPATIISASLALGLTLSLAACVPPGPDFAVSAETQTEANNLATVKKIYADFAAGNIEDFVVVLDTNMVWNEAENNLYAPDSPYVGVPSIVSGVFGPLGEEWDYFHVKPETYLADGDQVVMFGRYDAKFKATGKTMNPQIVHRWTLKDGKAVAFQQHMDTLAQIGVVTSDEEQEEE